MKATFLEHSGFLTETDNAYLLFDYYKGRLPELKREKPLYIFASHSHYDHYNVKIFDFYKACDKVRYILSDDIEAEFEDDLSELSGEQAEELRKNTVFVRPYERLVLSFEYIKSSQKETAAVSKETRTIKKLSALNETSIKNDNLKAELINKNETAEASEEMQEKGIVIKTLRSTDLGVAFIVETEGRRIFHAGDLQYWDWPGEPFEDNENMKRVFLKEMKEIEGERFDLAFLVLDPRQESSEFLGIDYILTHTFVKTAAPMHFWRDFRVVKRYKERLDKGEIKPLSERLRFIELKKAGESFEA